MRLLIQRIAQASVEVNKIKIAEINKGMLVFCGIEEADDQADIEWCTAKLLQLRIFNDEQDKMNLDISQVAGSLLIVSQFTLHAAIKKGNRPSFVRSAKPDYAQGFFNDFIGYLKQNYSGKIETGVFGADMKVSLINDGPVTIWIDSKNKE